MNVLKIIVTRTDYCDTSHVRSLQSDLLFEMLIYCVRNGIYDWNQLMKVVEVKETGNSLYRRLHTFRKDKKNHFLARQVTYYIMLCSYECCFCAVIFVSELIIVTLL